MEKMYRENQKLIKATAAKISNSSEIEKTELELQGNLIFVECCDSFDSERGATFKDYFKTTLYFELFKYLGRLKAQQGQAVVYNKAKENYENSVYESVDINSLDSKQISIPERTIAQTTLENLSRDARLVVNICLNPEISFPEEKRAIAESRNEYKAIKRSLTGMNNRRKESEVRIKKIWVKNYLKAQNWSGLRIEKAFYEIAEVL